MRRIDVWHVDTQVMMYKREWRKIRRVLRVANQWRWLHGEIMGAKVCRDLEEAIDALNRETRK